MRTLTIDGLAVSVADGATVLDACRALGIPIPTLCHADGLPPFTSCMVCVVKNAKTGKLTPSCSAPAEDGMVIETGGSDVINARRAAIELMLTEHCGDCAAPCHTICPADMNIPKMIRQIAAGDWADAAVTIKKDIPLPAILGRVCPAPCENGCRRKELDAAVSICLLKRYAADKDLFSSSPWLPERKPATGKRVSIIGAGPAGLTAVWYLIQDGHDCVIYDDRAETGGMLRYGIPRDRLPAEIIDKETALIGTLGARFVFNTRVGKDRPFNDILSESDAVAIATGGLSKDDATTFGLPLNPTGVVVNKTTGQTGIANVFLCAEPSRAKPMAVRAVATGKIIAESIRRLLSGEPLEPRVKPFNSRMGKLRENEKTAFVAKATKDGRVEPTAQDDSGFTDADAVKESKRCLSCDCAGFESCRLRQYADDTDATFPGSQFRREFEQVNDHPVLVFESGKCIRCGLCVRLSEKRGEKIGLAFSGRGYSMTIAVPLGRPFRDSLTTAAIECATACPTGALVIKKSTHHC